MCRKEDKRTFCCFCFTLCLSFYFGRSPFSPVQSFHTDCILKVFPEATEGYRWWLDAIGSPLPLCGSWSLSSCRWNLRSVAQRTDPKHQPHRAAAQDSGLRRSDCIYSCKGSNQGGESNKLDFPPLSLDDHQQFRYRAFINLTQHDDRVKITHISRISLCIILLE